MKTSDLIKEQLRDRDNFVFNRLEGPEAKINILKLMNMSLLFLLGYGFIIGLSHSFLQAGVTAIKLPSLFLITTIILFPTLYFFLAILKFEISSLRLISLLMVSISIMSISFFVFSPIALFFLITTNSYVFFKLINVLIFAIGGFLGLYTFYRNINVYIGRLEDNKLKARINRFLRVWVVLYALIGSQLSYSLSPFFGDPSEDFILFTETRRTFFEDIIRSLIELI